ncbi:MAG TPA: TlpA disulfide reductase family protein [Polyangiaceae bacterium]|nr:TlpA disulfide reductase family protein [Polyangiaceae bacterium]
MKISQLAQLVVVVVAAFAVYMFVRTAGDAEARRVCVPVCAMRPNYADQNRLAPDFELTNLSGRKVRLSDYRGKTVILNFWTKTCRPCLEEMPSLAELGRALGKRSDIVLVTVTTDETAEDARQTLASVIGAEPPFEVLIDPDSEVVTDKYGTKLYPETWFIDPSGVIRARVDGARDWSGALPVDFAEAIGDPIKCDLRFERGTPRGPRADLCSDVSPMTKS